MFHVKHMSALLTFVSRETLFRYETIFVSPGDGAAPPDARPRGLEDPGSVRRASGLQGRVAAKVERRRRQRPDLPPLPPPSCPDLFRASTSGRRLVPSRLAPRCRETWMAGTSPAMTAGGDDRGTGRRARGSSLSPTVGTGRVSGCCSIPGRVGTRFAARPAPVLVPRCRPGLVPGSGPAVRPPKPSSVFRGRQDTNVVPRTETGAPHWTEQVRGDKRGVETVSHQGPNPRRNSVASQSDFRPNSAGFSVAGTIRRVLGST